ncbi:MAG: hypothetical protein OKBPIBMD_01139 [Chlorobi bacterium]|nr:hypothetical protein [Chlorobiota bacterium]
MEKLGADLPGNAGPGQVILTHPNYPNCQLLVTYRAWFCVVGSEVIYRLSITGWAPIDINDPGCAGLKSVMYPSGYLGPVDQDFVLGMFNSLIPVVSEYYFINRPGMSPSLYPCPATFTTQEFVQGSCVKLVQSSYISTQPVILLDPFFKLAFCTHFCCTTTLEHCFDNETNTVQTRVLTHSGQILAFQCDDAPLITPPPSGTILSTTCKAMCPQE